jgi:hypothetical protein
MPDPPLANAEMDALEQANVESQGSIRFNVRCPRTAKSAINGLALRSLS